MISILVSNDEDFIQCITKTLKESGYEVIVYRWFLKALDNLQEISPDLIIINAKEYKRHWKIMTAYTNTLCNYASCYGIEHNIKIILFGNNEMSDRELHQAQKLGIRAILNSTNEDGLNKLKNLLIKNNIKPSIQFLFTNPQTQSVVTGFANEIANNTINFKPDFKSQIKDLSNGVMLRECLLLKSGKVTKKRGHILSITKNNPLSMRIFLED